MVSFEVAYGFVEAEECILKGIGETLVVVLDLGEASAEAGILLEDIVLDPFGQKEAVVLGEAASHMTEPAAVPAAVPVHPD